MRHQVADLMLDDGNIEPLATRLREICRCTCRRSRSGAGGSKRGRILRHQCREPLPERTAIGKSFRPTASRTCRSKPKPPSQDQNQIPCGCQSPLEKALEEDISIWHKPGHFYFALTRICLRFAEIQKQFTDWRT